MTRILLVFSLLLVIAGGSLLGQPVPNKPSDGSQDLPIDVTLGWRALSAVQQYEVNLSLSDAFGDAEIFITKEDEIEATNLQYQTTYFWRVRGLDGEGEPTTEWSGVNSFTTKSDKGIPQPVSPEDGATDQPRSVELKWTAGKGGTGYEVEHASTRSFAKSTIISTTGTSTTLSGLDYEEQVFWRVRITSAAGGPGEWSRYFSFTTEIKKPDPLLAPRLLSPSNGATDLPTAVKLVWGDVANGTSGEEIQYDLELATDATFGEVVAGTYGHDSTTFTVLGLEHETTYFWRARGYNTETESPWSDVWTFTTEKDSTAFLLAPGLLTPINGAGQIPVDPLLTWDSVEGAEFYEVQITMDAKFASDSIPSYMSDSTSLSVADLDYGAEYFWRARAGNENTQSAWSDPFRFVTTKDDLLLPNIPFLIAPADKASELESPIELLWSKADLAAQYFIQISPTGEFAGEEEDLTGFDTVLIVAELKEATEYFWRVKAINQAGESEWSEQRSFTTSGDVLPLPGLALLIAPPNTASDLDQTVDLVWNAAPNADSYTVQVSPTGAFAGEETITSATDTTMSLSDLKDGAEYFWRVKGTNNSGDGDWSETWSFKTKKEISGVTDEERFGSAVRLWPVPATGQLNVEIESTVHGPLTVELLNTRGEKMKGLEHSAISGGLRRVVVELSDVPSGLYYCRIVKATGASITRSVLILK